MEEKYIHLLLPAPIWEEIYEVGEEEYNKARLYAKEGKEYKQEMKDIEFLSISKRYSFLPIHFLPYSVIKKVNAAPISEADPALFVIFDK